MNVLMISQRKILPARDGALIGSLGLLKYLKEIDADTTLITFTEDKDYNEAERKELLQYVSELHSCRLHWQRTALNLSFKYPNNVRKYTRKRMVDAIERIKKERKFDVVIIDHLQLFEYSKLFSGERIVLHTHNVESDIWKEYASKCKGIVKLFVSRSADMTYAYECNALRKADGVIACSESDLMAFKKMVPEVKGVVLHSYNKLNRIKKDSDIMRTSNSIVFIGSYGWYPNQDAARFLAKELMPAIMKTNPGIKLYLVGKDPTDEIKAYANDNPQIIVTGTVDSVDPYIEKCDVFVNAVSMGSGINIKMIEAMGKGIPIVSTEFGSRGINCNSGKEFFNYRDVDECVKYINMILQDKEKACRMADEARSFYEEFITPSEEVKQMITGSERII